MLWTETAEPGTYVRTEAVFTLGLTHEWNHGLGEIISGLLAAGMRLTGLTEHDSVPWQALPGHMIVDEAGEWRLADRPERLAASYTLQAVKEESSSARSRLGGPTRATATRPERSPPPRRG
ncbi:hypothetical protein [Actinomadura sp. 9N407]|uniref:hypothetical protein n=1 Tax=Actinomadura sp. 9N407 TaxID=3375154 RepID=UPI0037893FDE